MSKLHTSTSDHQYSRVNKRWSDFWGLAGVRDADMAWHSTRTAPLGKWRKVQDLHIWISFLIAESKLQLLKFWKFPKIQVWDLAFIRRDIWFGSQKAPRWWGTGIFLLSMHSPLSYPLALCSNILAVSLHSNPGQQKPNQTFGDLYFAYNPNSIPIPITLPEPPKGMIW